MGELGLERSSNPWIYDLWQTVVWARCARITADRWVVAKDVGVSWDGQWPWAESDSANPSFHEDLLLAYDQGELKLPTQTKDATPRLNYEMALSAIESLKVDLGARGDATYYSE